MIYIELPIIADLYTKILLAILLSILVLLFLFILKKRRKNHLYDYYRDIPDNLPPAILKYYEKGKISDKSFWLTLLDLIRRDYFSIERIQINNQQDLKLKSLNKNEENSDLLEYEKLVFKTVDSIIKSEANGELILSELNRKMKQRLNYTENHQKIFRSLETSIRKQYGDIDKSLNYILCVLFTLIYFSLFFPINGALALISGLFFSLLVLCISMILKNLTFKIGSIIEAIGLLFILTPIIIFIIPTLLVAEDGLIYTSVLLNPLPIIINILILNTIFYDKKQQELVNKIEGLKRFLKDFTILKERPVEYINLAEHFYVLAETFNIKITDVIHPTFRYDNDMFDTLTALEFTERASSIYGDLFKMFTK